MSLYKNVFVQEAFGKFDLWEKKVKFSYDFKSSTNPNIPELLDKLEYYFQVKITVEWEMIFQYVKSFSHIPSKEEETLFWLDALEYLNSIKIENEQEIQSRKESGTVGSS
jgi:hypothetical protein